MCPRPLVRVEKVFFVADRKGAGLEIGPSHNPLAPKRSGYDVKILDHASAGDLREKYTGHGVDLGAIEEVDYVWKGEPLQELIGKTACFDWIIASHVMEHVPDLLSFLQQCSALLKPMGVLSLVVPDKRYCFDLYNRISTTGDVLDAFHQKRVRPTPGAVFDQYANHANINGAISWDAATKGPVSLGYSLEQAQRHWELALGTDAYMDIHCWRFTLNSLRLLLHDLKALGLIDLGIKVDFATDGCEFYASLCKDPGGL
ncbi:MAG TPA: methyltransferase domain-containing protein, partial [bacterium]|nr:methyltransferase domain-containing protein [bacterium]